MQQIRNFLHFFQYNKPGYDTEKIVHLLLLLVKRNFVVHSQAGPDLLSRHKSLIIQVILFRRGSRPGDQMLLIE